MGIAFYSMKLQTSKLHVPHPPLSAHCGLLLWREMSRAMTRNIRPCDHRITSRHVRHTSYSLPGTGVKTKLSWPQVLRPVVARAFRQFVCNAGSGLAFGRCSVQGEVPNGEDEEFDMTI
jgi:hypothetical protein